MQWLKKVFSASVDASRVNPVGLAVMLAGVLIVAFAGRLAPKLRPDAAQGAKIALKLVGLVVCAGGALLAILG